MTAERVDQTDFADGPATGLRIVEIGDLGEVGGKLLADAGAEVIRVEPPEGAASRHVGPFVSDRPDTNGSLRYAYFNTNKRSVTLDPTHSEAPAPWHALLGWADAVIDAAGPSVLDARGLGYEDCGDDRLIWCSVTPFGREGPWADWAVNDLAQIALGGPMMSTGYSDHDIPPIRADGEHSLWMGGEYAAIGVLAAAIERDRSGRGQLLDLSIHEAVSGTTEGSFPNWEYHREYVQRQTGRHSSVAETPRWQFRCADGQYLNIIGGGLPRAGGDWHGLLAWLDEHDAAQELHEERFEQTIHAPRHVDAPERGRASEVIEEFLGTIPAEEAYRGGQRLHLPWGIVRRPEDNLDDPHWADRGFFHEIEVPGHPEPVRVPSAPYRFEETPLRTRRRPPLLGEHNHEVYVGELGLGADELQRLVVAAAI